jgi:hypothetical protein
VAEEVAGSILVFRPNAQKAASTTWVKCSPAHDASVSVPPRTGWSPFRLSLAQASWC